MRGTCAHQDDARQVRGAAPGWSALTIRHDGSAVRALGPKMTHSLPRFGSAGQESPAEIRQRATALKPATLLFCIEARGRF